MRKFIVVIGFAMLISICTPQITKAQTKHEQLLEDTVITLLNPQISESITNYYGQTKQYDCPKLILTRKINSGSYYFEVQIQVRTFEGAHNPPNDLVTMKFTNFPSTKWHLTHFESKRIQPDEQIDCRKPT